jgi:hypothetical protein
MRLLGDKAQVEARFGPFGDSATFDARLVHGLRRTYHLLRNHLTYPMVVLETRLKWKLDLVRLEIVLILMQARCTACTKHTIGSAIVFNAPHGTRK